MLNAFRQIKLPNMPAGPFLDWDYGTLDQVNNMVTKLFRKCPENTGAKRVGYVGFGKYLAHRRSRPAGFLLITITFQEMKDTIWPPSSTVHTPCLTSGSTKCIDHP